MRIASNGLEQGNQAIKGNIDHHCQQNAKEESAGQKPAEKDRQGIEKIDELP
jgi:hypothetical protein